MTDLKLPKHISGCGEYGKGYLDGMKHQNVIAFNEGYDQAVADIKKLINLELPEGWRESVSD